ncbi:MAG: protein-glutamate O-methyltransferase CheR [Bacillota bacterium]
MSEIRDFAEFKEKFYQFSGLNLDCYKDRQMERRIRQFIDRENYGNFSCFLDKLREDPEVLHNFFNYITINTSGFFRDEKVYEYLQNTVLVELLKQHDRINIWSMGASRGEEPYTLAIILNELSALGRANILASDIDDKARAMAQEGCYAAHQLEKMPPALLKGYFEQRNGGYYISDRIKKAVTFQKHNFLAPIYGEMSLMQLVLCRNVFIYFKTNVQDWMIEQIARLIVPGGFFVTGCAEFVNNPQRYGLERKIPAVYHKRQ